MEEKEPQVYLLPAPAKKVDERQVALKDWDRRILYMVYRGKPWTEIARATGRTPAYVKKVAALPEFQEELVKLREEVGDNIVEQTIESIKNAKEMRALALQALHVELLNGISQAKIASAKVLLDEAHREEMLNKGERERPMTLNEVRKMSVAEALDFSREHQIKRSGK